MENASVINTTTEDISLWIKDVREKLESDDTFMVGLDTSTDSQKATEKRWLSDTDVLIRYLPFEGCGEIPNFEKQFHDPPTMESAVLSADSIIGVGGASGFEAYNRFWSYIQNLRTHAPTLPVDRNAFLLKTPIGGDPNRDISSESIHEAIIGIYGTNSLRLKIPNFTYIYGVVCHDDTTSLIIENISPFITMSKFCERASAGEFFGILIQILYSLKCAKEAIGFTHYDLHTDNVLLRDVGMPQFYIPYEDGSVFVRAKKIATIVGFGRSHIFASNSDKRRISFGCIYPALVPLGIFRDRSFPIADAYKLLIHSLSFMKDAKNPAFDKVSALVKYFNQSESVSDIINLQSDNYYSLPPTSRARGYSLEEFIEFSRNVCSRWPDSPGTVVDSDTIPKSAKIFACGRGFIDCDAINSGGAGEIRSANSDAKIAHMSMVKPITLFGFFDIHAYLVKLRESGNTFSRDVLREYAGAYIKGFTRGESNFQPAVKNMVEMAQDKYRYIKKHLEPDEGGTHALFKYHSLSSNFNPSENCIETIKTTTLIFSVFKSLIELLRVFKYSISVYWPEEKGEQTTCEILSAYTAIVDIIARQIKPLGEIRNLLLLDAKMTSPEKFGLKASAELSKARKSKSSKIAFMLENIYPTWQMSDDAMNFGK